MNRFVSVILLIMMFNVGNRCSTTASRTGATIWAGADINIGRQGVQYFPDRKAMMQTYVSSLKRFIDIGNKAGADVLISTNNRHANTFEKIRTWRIMNPDESGGGNADGILADVMKVEHDPHPFVGKDDVNRFYGILLECFRSATGVAGKKLNDRDRSRKVQRDRSRSFNFVLLAGFLTSIDQKPNRSDDTHRYDDC